MSQESSTTAETERVSVETEIVGVVVHGRGAVVTRRLTASGPLPDDACDLIVGGITPLCDPGSVRVSMSETSRRLIAVHSKIEVPERDEGPGGSVEALEVINRRFERLVERESALRERAKRLREIRLDPAVQKKSDDPVTRLAAALTLSEVIDSTLRSIDRRIVGLRAEMQQTQKERADLELADRQESSQKRMGESHPTRAFEIRVGAGPGGIDGAEISYAVPYAAKWWPAYALRLTDGGKRATVTIEGFVAQRTGEDWDGVPIGLSTSEIIFDATLPRFPSLRLGKQQPRASHGFREPPSGVDKLFHSYDEFLGQREPPAPQGAPAPSGPHGNAQAKVLLAEEEDTLGGVEWESAAAEPMPTGGAMPPQQAPMPSPAMSMPPMSSRGGFFPSRRAQATPSDMLAAAPSGYGGGGAEGSGVMDRPVPPPEPSFEPGTEWLEFDSLVLAGPKSARRGRLERKPTPGGLPTSELYDAQESARRLNLVDPTVSRGMFDFRYDSEGTIRVPADGRLHRVTLMEAEADSRLVWRTVPAADPSVYREVWLDNPLGSPLLAGPVDVFSEGELVTMTPIERVDVGGSIHVGLGVDERIRVARNVRVEEESAGLLKGKREVSHDVDVELRSGLGFDAEVEVVDRIPITDDDNVDVTLVSESPNGEDYDQSELGSPVRGGRKWKVSVPRGGKASISFRYEITLRSKDELVGGNRRD